MEINSTTRVMLKAQSAAFVLLLFVVVGLLAWISNRFVLQFDWTSSGRNTLSEASQRLLDELEGPVQITAYAREDKVRRTATRDLVDRYRNHKPDIELSFVNPERAPDEARRLGIKTDGELIVRYAGRSEHVLALNERSLSNAFNRVARPGQRRIVYLTGHGERDLLGKANHDLGNFGAQLEQRGFTINKLNLAELGAIPENTTVLVLSEGEIGPLPGELALIGEFVDRGGNLLWLSDPAESTTMEPLARKLGLRFVPGKVLEPTTRVFGVQNRAVVVVTDYGDHAVTDEFKLLTVLPEAVAMAVDPKDGWEVTPILRTTQQSWSETGDSGDDARFDKDSELSGPLDVGLALSRRRPQENTGAMDQAMSRQRVVIIGDGDFLSNTYLGNGGNLDLGLNLFNWLGADDAFINIPARASTDLNFNLSRTMSLVVAFVPLAVLPVILLATGFFVWRVRRTR
jgi:ABC-type uncharacterized transport system involved in gliding motility auxiliary subunit